jgi:Domain of unknown function (DUF5943)/V4R domain
MAAPQIPIDVDATTGIWRTDGLPMVYLPRHFLVNNHLAAEEALGLEVYRSILRQATEKSALHWCRSESRTHGLEPEATFRHYFKRLSQRGWGRFTIELLDRAGGRGRIGLKHSIFALERGPSANGPVCYMFEGFMMGAFRYLIGDNAGAAEVDCHEAQCAAAGRYERCRFEFAAAI